MIVANVETRWRLVICKHGTILEDEKTGWRDIFDKEAASVTDAGTCSNLDVWTSLQLVYRYFGSKDACMWSI